MTAALAVTIDPVQAAAIAARHEGLVPWTTTWWRRARTLGYPTPESLLGTVIYIHGDATWGAREQLSAATRGLDASARSAVVARGRVVGWATLERGQLTTLGGRPGWAPRDPIELRRTWPRTCHEQALIDDIEPIEPVVATPDDDDNGLWVLPDEVVARLVLVCDKPELPPTVASARPPAERTWCPGVVNARLRPSGWTLCQPIGPDESGYLLHHDRWACPDVPVALGRRGSVDEVVDRLRALVGRVEGWWPGARAALAAEDVAGMETVPCASCGLPTAARAPRRGEALLAGAGFVDELATMRGVVCGGRNRRCTPVNDAPLACSTLCERRLLKARGRSIASAAPPAGWDEARHAVERRLIRAAGDDVAAVRRGILALCLKRRPLPAPPPAEDAP